MKYTNKNQNTCIKVAYFFTLLLVTQSNYAGSFSLQTIKQRAQRALRSQKSAGTVASKAYKQMLAAREKVYALEDELARQEALLAQKTSITLLDKARLKIARFKLAQAQKDLEIKERRLVAVAPERVPKKAMQEMKPIVEIPEDSSGYEDVTGTVWFESPKK